MSEKGVNGLICEMGLCAIPGSYFVPYNEWDWKHPGMKDEHLAEVLRCNEAYISPEGGKIVARD